MASMSKNSRPDDTLFADASGPGNQRDDGGGRPGTKLLVATRFVRVAVERGIDSVELSEGLTYRCDLPGVVTGDRVRVPLGSGNKPVRGIVLETGGIELLDGYAPEKVKAVLEHDGGGLPANMVELARWLSSYYVCPLGMVLSSMVPAAVKHATGRRSEVVLERVTLDETSVTALPKNARAMAEKIATLPGERFPTTLKSLVAELGLKTTASVMRLVKLGVLSASTRAVIRDSGWTEPEVVNNNESGDGGRVAHAPPSLTDQQSHVVERIGKALGAFSVHLLRGVTGSGKTEVYLRLIERTLAAGRSAIVLVPEIALTPQTSRRFRERFAALGVSVLHSGLSSSQRHGEWDRVRRGLSRVVVGARSAVFAPLDSLGLIVVDEEHDSSYKQDQLPRYNARDVAIKRAQLARCPVVLGSATPSLESWANVKPGVGVGVGTGAAKFSLWELAERVGGGEMPRVEIVDLAAERRVRAQNDPGSVRRQHALGPTLESAIGKTLDAGGQVILLLNRRGFAHYIACPDAKCGWVLTCDDCDATLVLHKDRALPRGEDVACHHCLSRRIMPRACPTCGKAVVVFGIGTQRLEEELLRSLGGAHGLDERTMLRVDSDTMESARDYFDALGRFARGEVRLLLGTQMIAKGLDFPNVRLVGVVNADTSLNLPDFRAAERTFQLVSQVAGRAGRSAGGGRVIVQTMEPRSPPIVLAARHDYVTFADQELAIRRRSGLPPATRMARVVCRDKDAAKASASAGRVAGSLRESLSSLRIAGRVEGPAACAVDRTHGQYRFEVTITAEKAGEIQRVLAACRSAGVLTSDAHTAVDVDPVSLM